MELSHLTHADTGRRLNLDVSNSLNSSHVAEKSGF